MATLCCSFCNKTYIRKAAYNNHIEKCKLHYYCKNSKPQPSINIEDITIENMPINNESIFKLLINLQNKYEKLQEDYDELKKYVINKKSKIKHSLLPKKYYTTNSFFQIEFLLKHLLFH